MSASSELGYDHDGPVVTLSLNRPKVFNALTPELEADLHEALDRADRDPAARAIILTGEGAAFCAGYDMSGRGGAETGPLDPAGRSHAEYLAWFHRADSMTVEHLMHIWRLTKPVIAAVNGYAMGAGFWYQLACDITIASDRAVFAQPEVRHGSNSTYLFAALCGWKAANRYTLTGDHFDAAEALRIGLVNEVVAHDDLMSTARRLAERIALVPEASVRLNKAITMQGLQAAGVHAGMVLNGALSVIAHASHGPERERLFAAQRERGMRGYLEERDDPFRPEPFGPRSRAKPATEPVPPPTPGGDHA
jgi:enoyl-CoA hydratase/carnithine racemase